NRFDFRPTQTEEFGSIFDPPALQTAGIVQSWAGTPLALGERGHHRPEREPDTIMAETVHLFLNANGTEIAGESTQTTLGREGSIEGLCFEDSVRTAREKGTGMATGRRSSEPIVFRKRIDKSSP